MPGPVEVSAVSLKRRRVLALLGAAASLGTGAPVGAAPPPPAAAAGRTDHFPFGPLAVARPIAPWRVTTHRGQTIDLPAILRGRITALQMMFTGCGATCPIQGALFAQAQARLGDSLPVAQFVSLSIDPLGDTPPLLQAWLQRFGAREGWTAVVPRMADVDAIVERLGGGGEPRPRGPDPHTGQVYLIDRRAELVFRTPSMPRSEVIVDGLRTLAARPV